MEKLLTFCLHQLLGVFYSISEWATLTILAVSSVLLTVGLFRMSVYLVKTLTSTNRLICSLGDLVTERRISLDCGSGMQQIPVNVISSDEKRAAFSMGWLKPAIYMTSALIESSTPPALDIILRHELSHCRRRDPLRIMLLNAVSELLWFVPVIKPQVDNWTLAAEMACDKSALDAGHDKLDVAKVLVELAAPPILAGHHASPALSSIRDHLEFRVKSLLGENSFKSARIRPGLIIASLLIVSSILISSTAVITVSMDPGGQVTMLQQTVGACTYGHHESDFLSNFGIECPHCGPSVYETETASPPMCHDPG